MEALEKAHAGGGFADPDPDAALAALPLRMYLRLGQCYTAEGRPEWARDVYMQVSFGVRPTQTVRIWRGTMVSASA